MDKHYPYKAALYDPEQPDSMWWPECSLEEDRMVIGDGIPGDLKSAELCARCCNIAYRDALDDVKSLFKLKGIDVSKLVNKLLEKN